MGFLYRSLEKNGKIQNNYYRSILYSCDNCNPIEKIFKKEIQPKPLKYKEDIASGQALIKEKVELLKEIHSLEKEVAPYLKKYNSLPENLPHIKKKYARLLKKRNAYVAFLLKDERNSDQRHRSFHEPRYEPNVRAKAGRVVANEYDKKPRRSFQTKSQKFVAAFGN